MIHWIYSLCFAWADAAQLSTALLTLLCLPTLLWCFSRDFSRASCNPTAFSEVGGLNSKPLRLPKGRQ